jgi:transcriptional regulator with XRE-family HTH domain
MSTPALPVELAHRIRIERKRLGQKQELMARLCATSREMWSRYERGTHPMPGNVFRAFIDAGADDAFLRTGVRSPAAIKPAPGQDNPETGPDIPTALAQLQHLLNRHTGSKTLMQLSLDEHELVQAYRAAPQAWREVFDDLVQAQKRRHSA